MAVLLGFHPDFEDHEPGPDHPESPHRLTAVRRGIEAAHLGEAVIEFAPRYATHAEIGRVHNPGYAEALEEKCLQGGGYLDPDTEVSPGSFAAARRAAGAGLEAIERLDRNEAAAAFLAVRPPGHHAYDAHSMGFCLFNNLAITASELISRGDRVLIVDWDAHHGNGTQNCFYTEPNVLFISLHQYPFYPGTGSLDEVGEAEGRGCTINVPLPAGTAGDAYRLAFDELVVPAAEAFSPSWLLVSAGFDAHRSDPLCDLGLSSGDFADLARSVSLLVAPGRRIFFLEGGYNLSALAASAGATVAALVGEDFRPEPATTGAKANAFGSSRSDRPAQIIAEARAIHERSRSL
jgi:acetoin utilization deacetylase AcuC-like enzyme